MLGAFCLVSFVSPRLDSFLFRKNGIQVSWLLIQYFLYYDLLSLFNYSFWNNFGHKQKICKKSVSFTQLQFIYQLQEVSIDTISIIAVVFINWNSLIRKNCPLASVYSVIHVYQSGSMDVYFILWGIVHYYHYIVKIFQNSHKKHPQVDSYVLFTCLHL